MKIVDINYYIEHVKLKQSYMLSYKSLDSYDAVVTKIILDNNIIYGEVTPLEGYTDETIEDILKELDRIKPLVIGEDIENSLKILYDEINEFNSFALSALVPPIENYLYNYEELYSKILLGKKDLIYALKIEQDKDDILNELEQIIINGYITIKIKVGKCLKNELEIVELLANFNLGNLKIRFDANGGYSFNEADIFLKSLSKISNNVEYLEQPLCRKCWNELEALINMGHSIPIMIDESIYSLNDIKKSYDIGAKFIKIKLCKYGSLHHLQKALDYAKSLGLNVVFGNGVSTDIANYYELNFYSKNKSRIYGATESVGFLKTQKYLKYNLKERFEDE